MIEFCAVLALVIASVLIGAFAVLVRELRDCRLALVDEREHFAGITAQASTANLSLANKVGELDRKVETLSFQAQSSQFGARK